MKKASSILFIIVFVLSFAASPCFSGLSAFASSSPVTWEDLGEDAIALRDSYFNLWRSGSAGDFFRNAADIPVSWFKMLSDGVLALSPIDDLFFTYEEVKPVIRTGSPKMRDWVSKHNITPDTPVISSDDFSAKIDEQNASFTPKNSYYKISYRTDDEFQKFVNFPSTARTTFYSPYIIDNSKFVNLGTSAEMFFLLFYAENGTQYFSQYQFRIYFDINQIWYEDRDEIEKTEKFLRLQVWDNINGSQSDAVDLITSDIDVSAYNYCYLDTVQGRPSLNFRFFKTYTNFLNDTYNSVSVSNFVTKYTDLYLPDLSSSVKYNELLYANSSHQFKGTHVLHDSICSSYDDIGLLVSSSPIAFSYSGIDTTKIPSNQIITVNGDTIYNYTITNPDSGDSSKLGDYITNNYTYITNNYGSGENGSGSSSGSVTVGGQIDVSGAVGVDITVSVPDININVNGNGSGAGDSVSLPNTDLVENLPEAPSGFIEYTASLFSFLPAEILSLLIAGLAAAIFCRIWGR